MDGQSQGAAVKDSEQDRPCPVGDPFVPSDPPALDGSGGELLLEEGCVSHLPGSGVNLTEHVTVVRARATHLNHPITLATYGADPPPRFRNQVGR